APQAARPSSVAVGGRVFVNDRLATTREHAEFERIEQAAVLRPAPGAPAARTLRTRGAVVQPGSTFVWDVPRGVGRRLPTVVVDGDQVVRITSFDEGESLLADVEVQGTDRYALPAGTRRIAVAGLGRPAAAGGDGGPVMLSQASERLAVVGWQAGSQLVQVGPLALLARGAVVSTAAPLDTRRDGRVVEQAIVSAWEAIGDGAGVETHFPAAITTLGILLERRDGAADASVADGLGVSVRGATASAKPITVAGGARALLLYDLRADAAAERVSVAVAHRPGWRIGGVVGMRDSAAHWAATLALESFESLVEEGPLTAYGAARVAFAVEAPAPRRGGRGARKQPAPARRRTRGRREKVPT
ncbi:MAG TPA: hypothetical protein VNA89_00655, partial [Gemmatimonadaceae bacterium]|nr:hypothetical protein [Gemmatimonadaceae bacterium]